MIETLRMNWNGPVGQRRGDGSTEGSLRRRLPDSYNAMADALVS